ncbi:MAG: hypothetical protein KC417_13360 [Myxococcales bacterium]|nr:hypothetical protein [Myxococcales bacterium]
MSQLRPILLATAPTHPRASVDTATLLAALEASGATGRAVQWDAQDVDFRDHVVLLHSPWDYQHKLETFLSWCDAVETTGQLVNPAATVRWNIHKRYLLELAAGGVPTLPTALLDRSTPLDDARQAAERAAGSWATTKLVWKPAVGAGADGLFVWDVSTPFPSPKVEDLLVRGDVLLQAYAGRIETEGELSVVCFEGIPAHVVHKFPAAGDYRVQLHFGGRYEVRAPRPEEAHLAERILAAAPHPNTYARVDLIPSPEGGWALGELEVIEPELFLRHAPESAARFAGVLARIAA